MVAASWWRWSTSWQAVAERRVRRVGLKVLTAPLDRRREVLVVVGLDPDLRRHGSRPVQSPVARGGVPGVVVTAGIVVSRCDPDPVLGDARGVLAGAARVSAKVRSPSVRRGGDDHGRRAARSDGAASSRHECWPRRALGETSPSAHHLAALRLQLQNPRDGSNSVPLIALGVRRRSDFDRSALMAAPHALHG